MLRAWVLFGSVGLALACSSTSEPTGDTPAPSSGGTGGTAGTGAGTAGDVGTAGTAGAGGAPVAGTGGTPGAAGSAAGTTGSAGTGAGGDGTAGTAGSAGTGGSGTGGGGNSTAVVQDDFESQAAGSPPNPELFTVSGPGTVQVSNEQAHSGAQSVKVVGNANSTMFWNKSVFPLPNGVVHFRVWMRFENADWMNHIAFVAASPGQESEEVRFGGQNNAYHANIAADGDGLSPNPWLNPCELCTAPVANTWTCLRGMFDFTNNRAQLYVGDKLAVDAKEKADWHSGNGILPSNPTQIGFGWALYGGVANTVYYDDLAIGYEPIPCE